MVDQGKEAGAGVPQTIDPTPVGVLSLGARIAPAETRFVVGGLVVLAGAALVGAWTHGLPALALTAVLVVVAALFVFLLLRARSSPRIGLLGELLAYALVALALTALVLVMSSPSSVGHPAERSSSTSSGAPTPPGRTPRRAIQPRTRPARPAR